MDQYVENLDTIPKNDIELRRAILHAAAQVDRDELKKACLSVYERCKLCLAQDGGRFEYLK